MFFALELPRWLQNELATLQGLLPGSGQVKWVKRENIHLTVQFLGEVGLDRLEVVESCAQEVIAIQVEFPIEVEGLGVFGSWNRPRVIWAGIGQGHREVTNLANHLARALANKGGFHPSQRAYHPHVTLGRFRTFSGQSEEVKTAVETSCHRNFGSFIVKGLVLMESVLTPQGPLYYPRGRYAFNG